MTLRKEQFVNLKKTCFLPLEILPQAPFFLNEEGDFKVFRNVLYRGSSASEISEREIDYVNSRYRRYRVSTEEIMKIINRFRYKNIDEFCQLDKDLFLGDSEVYSGRCIVLGFTWGNRETQVPKKEEIKKEFEKLCLYSQEEALKSVAGSFKGSFETLSEAKLSITNGKDLSFTEKVFGSYKVWQVRFETTSFRENPYRPNTDLSYSKETKIEIYTIFQDTKEKGWEKHFTKTIFDEYEKEIDQALRDRAEEIEKRKERIAKAEEERNKRQEELENRSSFRRWFDDFIEVHGDSLFNLFFWITIIGSWIYVLHN